MGVAREGAEGCVDRGAARVRFVTWRTRTDAIPIYLPDEFAVDVRRLLDTASGV